MISAEVQKILDRAKESSSLVQSVHLGMEGLKQQVADLKAKIDSMPVGNALSDEDKGALQEAAGQLDSTITSLKSDIPANVTEDGSQGQQSGNQQSQGQQSQGDQSAGSDGGGAKPLPGTGQS